MTSEEIKQSLSMRSVIESYGIRVDRKSQCSCPFHGADKHPSMKVYKDSFFCFTCQTGGDMFAFVQKMDNCDFPTAFQRLGGTYEKQKTEHKFALYHAENRKDSINRDFEKWHNEYQVNNSMIHHWREMHQKADPPFMTEDGEVIYPEQWCYTQAQLDRYLQKDSMLEEEGREKHWLK